MVRRSRTSERREADEAAAQRALADPEIAAILQEAPVVAVLHKLREIRKLVSEG